MRKTLKPLPSRDAHRFYPTALLQHANQSTNENCTMRVARYQKVPGLSWILNSCRVLTVIGLMPFTSACVQYGSPQMKDEFPIVAAFSHAQADRHIASPRSTQRRYLPVTVHFANDSAELDDTAKKHLLQFVNQFSPDIKLPLIIEGHTDANHSESYNLELAARRARSVCIQLNKLGYPEYQMTERSTGEQQPVATNATSSGRQLNRRVTVRLQYPADASQLINSDTI